MTYYICLRHDMRAGPGSPAWVAEGQAAIPSDHVTKSGT